MPNQNAPPKVAAPQSEAASLERELADDLGDKLSTGWLKYTELFGEPPHGTTKQMAALVDLSCVDALLSAERQRRELRKGLELALIPMAALVVSGECVNAPTALTEELKQAILTAHDEIVKLLAPEAETLLEGETK